MSKTEILRQSTSAGNANTKELLDFMKQQDQRLAQIEQNQAQILQALAQPAPQQPPQYVEATVTIPPEILVSLETASTLLSNASEALPQQAKQVLSETINRDHSLTTQLYEVAAKAAKEMSVAATKHRQQQDEIKQQAKESHDSRMGLGTLLVSTLIAGAIGGLSSMALVKDRFVRDMTWETIRVLKEQQNQQRSPATLRSR